MGCLIKKEWKLVPVNLPTISRSCPKCETKRDYVNTGRFRINANKKNVDVWMIYQCARCKSTWNMTIYERIHPGELQPDEYRRLMANDEVLIRAYAFDIGLHKRNRAEINLNGVQFAVEKNSPDRKSRKKQRRKYTCEVNIVRISAWISCWQNSSR